MQYFDFDFEKDKEFLNNSKVFKEMVEKIEKDSHLIKCEPAFVSSCLKLWAESVLKHNLNASTGRIEYLNLITEENSKEVVKNIGKIIFKKKEKRTDEDYKKLRDQALILLTIDIEVGGIAQAGKDICKELKAEFIDFKKSFTTTMVSKKAKM